MCLAVECSYSDPLPSTFFLKTSWLQPSFDNLVPALGWIILFVGVQSGYDC